MDTLSLDIHWPFCASKCPSCDLNSHVRAKVEENVWREALLQDLPSTAEKTRGRTRRLSSAAARHRMGVKAQVHAGGRGQERGIKIAKSLDQVREYAHALIGSNLITPHSDRSPRSTNKSDASIYIEQGSSIAKEFDLSMLLDRERGRLMMVASAA